MNQTLLSLLAFLAADSGGHPAGRLQLAGPARDAGGAHQRRRDRADSVGDDLQPCPRIDAARPDPDWRQSRDHLWRHPAAEHFDAFRRHRRHPQRVLQQEQETVIYAGSSPVDGVIGHYVTEVEAGALDH